MKKALLVTGALLGIAGAIYLTAKKNQKVKAAVKKGLNWAERQGKNLLEKAQETAQEEKEEI